MSNSINGRLKEARKKLGLSQEYVSSVLGVHRTTITAIESGTRKVTTDELASFSNLYGVPVDVLMGSSENAEEVEVKMFARAFSALSEQDKKEIMNLIDFKKRYRESQL